MTIKTLMNKQVSREMIKRSRIVFLIFLLVGLAGLIAYISLAIKLDDAWYLNIILFPSAVFFAVGLVYSILIIKNGFKIKDDDSNYNETTFEKDYLINVAYRQGEKIEESKIYYNKILFFKETKSYFFLYITKVSALPILKENNRDALAKIIVENMIKGSKL